MCNITKYLVFFFLLYLSMCIESKPCKTRNSHPKRGNITYYRSNFLFLKEHHPRTPGSPSASGGVTRRSPGTRNCGWTWDVDLDTARKPVSIATAKCTNCDLNKCRAIIYNHNVLVERKDCKTGEMVWTWTTEALPIAFVYDV